MSNEPRYVVIGGGIVGLAVAERLARCSPRSQVTVIEKEDRWALHQTARNSGVIHSGLYYKPGSLKATMCRRGAESIRRFASDEGVPVDQCGKLVIATNSAQVPALTALAERGRQNGLTVHQLSAGAAADIEPHVSCVAALHVPGTGIIDYSDVCAALVRRLTRAGADLRLGARVTGLHPRPDGATVQTDDYEVTADAVVNCGGLYSDEIMRLGGRRPAIRIIPFRGEYFELREDRRHLVRSLIYPVPDPRFPFLGVHLTRMIGGSVHAGPNAVLALAREGYDWRTLRPRELAGTLAYRGFWRLAARHLGTGAAEVRRSMSRHQFAESVRELVPAIRDEDLEPGVAGVRAQAVRPDGTLVDDFVIERDGRVVHVLNAPSPAATAALEIAAHVAAAARVPN